MSAKKFCQRLHRFDVCAEDLEGFRSGEIRILDSGGNVDRVIPFNEADRKL